MRAILSLSCLVCALCFSACGNSGGASSIPENAPSRQLGNTQWRFNPNVTVNFRTDGTYFFSDWGDKRGTYQVVTAQTVQAKTYSGISCEFTVNPTLEFIAWRDGNGEFGLAPRVR